MSSPLFIVGLDDLKLSDGTHLRGRTLLIRKLGRSDATNDVRDGSSHTKNRVGVNDFVLNCRRCSVSRELAWSEPEFPARRERYLALFSAATPSGQVAEAPRRVHWACWSGLQRLRSSAPRWRPRWPPPQIVLRSCDFFVSQRRLAPPGRVRGPRAAQEGSGALGDVLIRSSYSLEASGTRQHTCQRAAGGRGKWREMAQQHIN